MSIWCSWPDVGHDPHPDEPIRGGEVRTYAQGFSNHYPDTNGTHELPASVGIASIPPWCVPGREDLGEDESDAIAPWLRLGLYAEDSLTWWPSEPGGTKPRSDGPICAEVVIDEAAVRQLCDDLTAWLDRPKAHPIEGTHA